VAGNYFFPIFVKQQRNPDLYIVVCYSPVRPWVGCWLWSMTKC